ncbi:NUDIX domain-containing protein [Candidatus Woesearchaeota archaeon]|nr:NUDIX domain-containing protein [Candidatus Woesearchaeota archaeon]
MSQIPSTLYTQILEHMPIPAVDFVLVHNNKVLLALRKDEPAKGQWWIPGGRVQKNETLETAVKRKALQEVGIEVEIVRKINCYEVFFDTAPFPDVKTGVHYLSVCFLVKPKDKNVVISLDKTQEKHKWVNKIENNLHEYVKQVLKDSNVFEQVLKDSNVFEHP